MSFKSGRIEEYRFSMGSLTANSTGHFDVYSAQSINGVVQSILLNANSHTTTGSYLIFVSGLANSGTALGDLIITLRAGSTGVFYPITYGRTNQAGTGSPQAFEQFAINGPVRIVGSGLLADSSGLGLVITYK